jgi:hypothetical protein
MGFGTPRPCPLLTQTEDLHVASGMGWNSHPLHPSLYSQSIPGCQPTSGAPYPQAPASMCVPRSPRVNWLWYSCSPLLQALIVGYAFHFPHLLSPVPEACPAPCPPWPSTVLCRGHLLSLLLSHGEYKDTPRDGLVQLQKSRSVILNRNKSPGLVINKSGC